MKKTITIIIAVVTCFLSMSFGLLNSSGKIGKTNSPGESTCNDSGCHTGNTLNASGGSITITAPALTSWQYMPGQVYTINVTVERTGISLFGFDFEALTSTGANAGTITVTDAVKTQVGNVMVSGNSRRNITHKTNGGAGNANSHTFTFDWAAPATDIGNITFYAAGNAANGNSVTSGDFIYTTSQIVSPVPTGITDKVTTTIDFSVYPNPVLVSGNLSYQLDAHSTVVARLIGLDGKTVITFFNESQSPGIKTRAFKIDPSIARGIYIIALDVNNNHSYKKIIIE